MGGDGHADLKQDSIVELKPQAGVRIQSTLPTNTVEGSAVDVFSSLNDLIYDQTLSVQFKERLSAFKHKHGISTQCIR